MLNSQLPFGFELINDRVDYLSKLLNDINNVIECVPFVCMIEDTILKYGKPEERFNELKQEVSAMFSQLAETDKRAVRYAETLSKKALETSDLFERSRQVLSNVAAFLKEDEIKLLTEVQTSGIDNYYGKGANTYFVAIELEQMSREVQKSLIYRAKDPILIQAAEHDEQVRRMMQQAEEMAGQPIDGRRLVRNVALYVYVEIERTRAYLDELISLYVDSSLSPTPPKSSDTEKIKPLSATQKLLFVRLLQDEGLFPKRPANTDAKPELMAIAALTGLDYMNNLKGNSGAVIKAEQIMDDKKRMKITSNQVQPKLDDLAAVEQVAKWLNLDSVVYKINLFRKDIYACLTP